MKILIYIIIATVPFWSYSQDSYHETFEIKSLKEDVKEIKPNLTSSYRSDQSHIPLGLGLVLGGSTFIVAGVLTSPTYVGGSTTILKPWYSQPGFWPILSGSICIGTGIIISIK